MKKTCRLFLLTVSIGLFSNSLAAQFGLSYHQSPLSFIGVNYEAGKRFLGELRIATNVYVGDLTAEGIVAYRFGNSKEFNPYLGAGIRLAAEEGGSAIVIPIGVNIYPFTRKNFGFHLEFTPFVGEEDFSDNIVRGSWGIRYRFGNKED